MEPHDPSIPQLQDLGFERFNELNTIMTDADPKRWVNGFGKLSWVKFEESIDIPFSGSEAFGQVFLQLARIVREVAIGRWGTHVLGYLNSVILSFSSCEADARYFPESRDLRINLGFVFLFMEFEKTFEWLSAVLRSGRKMIPTAELGAMRAPPGVKEEIRRFHDMYYAGGRLALTFKRGFASPIYAAILRFILSHEIGHLLYFAESEASRVLWRDTVWSDYGDAVMHYANTYKLAEPATDKLSRSALNDDVANNWCHEFVADGMGFHLALRLAQGEKIPRAAVRVLQIAVECFFHTLVTVDHGDIASKTHPPPLLRETMIMARKRQEHGVDWGQFMVEDWGSGTVTKALFRKLILEAQISDDLGRWGIYPVS